MQIYACFVRLMSSPICCPSQMLTVGYCFCIDFLTLSSRVGLFRGSCCSSKTAQRHYLANQLLISTLVFEVVNSDHYALQKLWIMPVEGQLSGNWQKIARVSAIATPCFWQPWICWLTKIRQYQYHFDLLKSIFVNINILLTHFIHEEVCKILIIISLQVITQILLFLLECLHVYLLLSQNSLKFITLISCKHSQLII